jgi:ferredoxin
MSFRVHIDSAICEGHGLCTVDAPEVFDADDAGYGVVGVAEVPDQLRQRLQAAVLSCPAGAITVTD